MNILGALEERRRSLAVGSPRRVVEESLDAPGLRLGPFIARRLKPYRRLEVHDGCVNRLLWHRDGRTLASVSDDLSIALTNVHEYGRDSQEDAGQPPPPTTRVATQHVGNIFGVCFLGGGGRIATGARDSRVCVSDILDPHNAQCYRCHAGSVKHVINDGLSDFVFYSGSYDGTVRQFDIREPHQCQGPCRNVIVNLARSSGNYGATPRRSKWSWADAFARMEPSEASAWVEVAYREAHWAAQSYDGTEVKAIAINPMRAELLALAASDSLVRVFDRRKLSLGHAVNDGVSVNFTTPVLEEVYMPHHFRNEEQRIFATHLAWSPNGERLAVTYESEHVYLFDRNFNTMAALRTGKPAACQYAGESEERSKTTQIRLMESHFARCRDSKCAQRNVARLLYLLLHRNHVGDARLCDSLAREASLAAPSDVMLVFRRIQACLLREHYYTARKLCLRGAQLSPQNAHHFEKIRRLCLLLLDDRVRETAYDEVTAALRSICLSPEIASPESDLDVVHAVAETVKEDGDSDSEMNASVGASLRYSVVGWRRWPQPETCLRLEEHLRLGVGVPDLGDTPSGSEEASEEEEMAVDYQNEVRVRGGHNVEYRVRGSVYYDRRDRLMDPRHYFTYSAEEGGSHAKRPNYVYERFPIPYLGEHELYRAIEDPAWRPVGNCQRFCGHCNFGTDIAEVSFWGDDVLVSGSAEGSVYLYDVRSGRVLSILRGHVENVNCVQVNPQGTMLATSGIDHHVQVWRPAEGVNRITERDVEEAVAKSQACYGQHNFMAPLAITELR